MQNPGQESSSGGGAAPGDHPHQKLDSSGTTTSPTATSSPAKSETETYSEHRLYMSDSSDSEEDSVSEEFEEDPQVETAKFLLSPDDEERAVDPETQARLEALLQAAGIGKLAAKDGKHLGDPEVLRRLTSSVSCALDEAAAALTRMRSDTTPSAGTAATAAGSSGTRPQAAAAAAAEKISLIEACTDGDVGTVRKLLTEGRSVHETSEEGESLLSLACSAGYFELAQVLLAMHANVEDRGIKGECTPLMEAASAGHLDIVRLLLAHGADVNAQSTSGNTPLMYGCAGGHTDVVKFLLENGANVEDHNENGHTPLMEAASAGHVDLAKILLVHGAGINTHSNEFKESALTLACYKGHLDMVRFLLEAGADQEHKTDEMHTALMEASMDGHVEVARLLLDSGAQVNMPTDSFESPLTLAACGGHVDLAMLLIERGANIEEVNDEGYTPLMEAAREGHEEMVHVLLGQGANINAQTDETQETALTLACCGGFTEVADILLKGGADIELGASTPLMEAAQEGHLDLVRFLLENGANVHAQTQTGDTALTYACENGHTDVADLLLQYEADLEHESEGGRTPLMKACRAGHMCTVQFLILRGANVRRQTTNNDHTPLSLACAGGHLSVVELLLSHSADPNHKLKDNSTMLIEAAKGGHTNVVQLLLDYPHSMQPIAALNQQQQPPATMPTTATIVFPPGVLPASLLQPPDFFSSLSTTNSAVLQEVPEAVRIIPEEGGANNTTPTTSATSEPISKPASVTAQTAPPAKSRKALLPKSRSSGAVFDGNLNAADPQQPYLQNFCDDLLPSSTLDLLRSEETNTNLIEFITNRKKHYIGKYNESKEKLQMLHGLHGNDPDWKGFNPNLKGRDAAYEAYWLGVKECCEFELRRTSSIEAEILSKGGGAVVTSSSETKPTTKSPVSSACLQPVSEQPSASTSCDSAQFGGGSASQAGTTPTTNGATQQPAIYFTPLPTSVSGSMSTATNTTATSAPSILPPQQPIKFQSVTSHAEVSQNTAISDRPKAKPVSKKEGKNLRKQQQLQQQQFQQPNIYCQQPVEIFGHFQQTGQAGAAAATPTTPASSDPNKWTEQAILNVQNLEFETLDQDNLILKENSPENLLTASILQQFHNSSIRATFIEPLSGPDSGAGKENKMDLEDTLTTLDVTEIQSFAGALDEPMMASLSDVELCSNVAPPPPPDLAHSSGSSSALSTVEYFSVPSLHGMYPYDHHLAAAALPDKHQLYQAGFQAGYNLSMQHLLASTSETPTTNTTSGTAASSSQYIAPEPATSQCNHLQTVPPSSPSSSASGGGANSGAPATASACCHMCQAMPCGQHQGAAAPPPLQAQNQQVASGAAAATDSKKLPKATTDGIKFKKGRILRHQNQPPATPPAPVVQHPPPPPSNSIFQPTQNYQIDHNSAITQYSGQNQTATSSPNIKIASVQTIQAPSTSAPAPVQYAITATAATPAAPQPCPSASSPAAAAPSPTGAVISPSMDVDSETESNHDTALTLACAGGHEELVELLINRGADIEHRDKKGFTPLILAGTAGHEKVVEILLNHNADIEAQSERTKDTPLSLACSGGRYEVVELLLQRSANKEHRNVSDYTPLSLAASGGYVNIIKLLLSHGAEINSRTGSKLGISPLMLAAMNGHTAAVKLLLDMGSDINAQIETNRNTALTLACFQGRHEVVSLLLDRKANVEHRAKTGLTPLMEAASGGYVEVGRVLLDKGADVNATPVPSSRDTALTIAADKGHVRFVELLLFRGAQVEVKNKKGNSPLWLAANGGHLPVVEILYNVNADIDSQDNRKVSCLMAAFRKGHVKVVKWMVHHVTQFPSDQEMIRYITTVSDKELLEKCHEAVKIIRAAKETQAAKANKNATILLEELDMEKTREESKRLAAARRRERKKKKKMEKKEERRKLLEENKKNENYDDKEKASEEEKVEEDENVPEPNPAAIRNGDANDKEEGDSGIDANSQGSCSSNDLKSKEKRKDKKKKKSSSSSNPTTSTTPTSTKPSDSATNQNVALRATTPAHSSKATSSKSDTPSSSTPDKPEKSTGGSKYQQSTSAVRKGLVFEATKSPAERDDFEATGSEVYVSQKSQKKAASCENSTAGSSISPKQASNKREEGWKEVVRKSSVQTVSTSESGVKKVSVPLNAISRVIGRGGSNINAIRGATGAHIEVEKQSKGQGERIITIKGSSEATKQAHNLIAALIKDPDVDILQMLPKSNKSSVCTTTLWDKTQIGTKKNAVKVVAVTQPSSHPVSLKSIQTAAPSSVLNTRTSNSVTIKPRGSVPVTTNRVTAPRLAAAQAEKNKNIPSFSMSTTFTSQVQPRPITTPAKPSTNQTFAAKLTETVVSAPNANKRINLPAPPTSIPAVSPIPGSAPLPNSPIKNSRPIPTASAPPMMQQQVPVQFQSPGKQTALFGNQAQGVAPIAPPAPEPMGLNARSSTPNLLHAASATCLSSSSHDDQANCNTPQEYSLFCNPAWRRLDKESQKTVNFAAVTGGGSGASAAASTVHPTKFLDQEPPKVVDASKAPGYRGASGAAMCSPVSSKTSSNSTTPPNTSAAGFAGAATAPPPNVLPPIGIRPTLPPQPPQQSHHAPVVAPPSQNNFYGDLFKGSSATSLADILTINPNESHAMFRHQGAPNYSQPRLMKEMEVSQSQPSVSMSRLNPKAPDFSSSVYKATPNQAAPPPAPPNMFRYSMPQHSNMYDLKCPNNGGGDAANFRSSQRWLQQQMQGVVPPNSLQGDMGMAGMNLYNLARVTGSELMENGGDMRLSPTMSPELSATMHHHEHYSLEERKAPPPIGTGRNRGGGGGGAAAPNWLLGEAPKMRWSVNEQMQILNRGNQLYPDEMVMASDFTRPSPLDSTPYQPYFNTQPIANVRPVQIMDQQNIELTSWEQSRAMADITEKHPGNNWNFKWNQNNT